MIDLCKVNRMKYIKLSKLKIIIKKNDVELNSLNEVKSFLSQ